MTFVHFHDLCTFYEVSTKRPCYDTFSTYFWISLADLSSISYFWMYSMEIFHVFTKEADLSQLKVSVTDKIHQPIDHNYGGFVIEDNLGKMGSELCSDEIDDAFTISREGVRERNDCVNIW